MASKRKSTKTVKRSTTLSRQTGARNSAAKPAVEDSALRQHVLNFLNSEGAHVDFDGTVADLAPELRGAKPEGAPHSPWQLLEHMRIAQSDILEFCRNPNHVSPKWPEGYWPETDAPPSAKAWDESVKSFRRDLEQMQALVLDGSTDLFARIPHGDGQTILREALLVADHNAYHLGQLVLVRKMLGAWGY